MTKKELIETCKILGLEFKTSMTKAELQQLVDDNTQEVESSESEEVEWEFEIEFEDKEIDEEDFEIITVKEFCKKNNIIGIKKKFLCKKYPNELLFQSEWREIVIKERI